MKTENGVANIADDVKCRLRKIAHSITTETVQVAVNDFLSWNNCKGKLRNWFLSKYIKIL